MVADGKDIGINRLFRLAKGADRLEVVDELILVHGPDVFFRKVANRHRLEEAGRLDLPQDGADAHRRLDVAPLLDVVDIMPVIDHQGDAAVDRDLAPDRCHSFRAEVAELPQPHRVVTE